MLHLINNDCGYQYCLAVRCYSILHRTITEFHIANNHYYAMFKCLLTKMHFMMNSILQ